MLWRVWAAVLLLAVSWVSLYYLTKVGKADVIAYREYQRAAGPGHDGYLPGDVVVLYRDGGMERICDLAVESEDRKFASLQSTYVNSLGQSLPFLVSVGHAFREILGLDNPDTSAPIDATSGEFSFSGFERSLSEIGQAGLSDSCACKIARWSARGERVCTINAALIESQRVPLQSGDSAGPAFQSLTRTVAVTLARHTNFLPEESYAGCGVEMSDRVRQVQQELCNDGETWPIDVRLRRMLNVIDEKPRSISASYGPR